MACPPCGIAHDRDINLQRLATETAQPAARALEEEEVGEHYHTRALREYVQELVYAVQRDGSAYVFQTYGQSRLALLVISLPKKRTISGESS